MRVRGHLFGFSFVLLFKKISCKIEGKKTNSSSLFVSFFLYPFFLPCFFFFSFSFLSSFLPFLPFPFSPLFLSNGPKPLLTRTHFLLFLTSFCFFFLGSIRERLSYQAPNSWIHSFIWPEIKIFFLSSIMPFTVIMVVVEALGPASEFEFAPVAW